MGRCGCDGAPQGHGRELRESCICPTPRPCRAARAVPRRAAPGLQPPVGAASQRCLGASLRRAGAATGASPGRTLSGLIARRPRAGGSGRCRQDHYLVQVEAGRDRDHETHYWCACGPVDPFVLRALQGPTAPRAWQHALTRHACPPRRLQRGDGRVQELLLHILGRGRSGQGA